MRSYLLSFTLLVLSACFVTSSALGGGSTDVGGVSMDTDVIISVDDPSGTNTTYDQNGNIVSGTNNVIKSFFEPTLASLAVVSSGGVSLLDDPPVEPGPSTFATSSGGCSKYYSGSYIDTEGFSLLAGVANGFQGYGILTLAAFFEGGWSEYETHNNFPTSIIRGNGEVEFYGGGIFTRYDLPSKLFAEAAFRIGWVGNEYSNNNILTASGNHFVKHDVSSTYYGGHLGLGYDWQLNQSSSLKFSNKFFFTHQGSSAENFENTRYDFDSADSFRWRIGGRYTHNFQIGSRATISPYAGVYFQYEFDGKSTGSINGAAFKDNPSLKGGHVIGEVGVFFKSSADSRLTFGLSGQGYLGKREGINGRLQLMYAF